jgi:hypothetical protein
VGSASFVDAVRHVLGMKERGFALPGKLSSLQEGRQVSIAALDAEGASAVQKNPPN